MKKTIHPNQGQPTQDIYVTGISRVFLDGGNVICVLESRCGIEDANNTYINETARLILPSHDLGHMKESLMQALQYAEENIQGCQRQTTLLPEENKPISETVVETEGHAIAVFD